MTKSKNELVVKDNRLIEAGYRLDLVEQRIILLAITEARKTQKGLNAGDFVVLRAKDYAETYGVSVGKAYEHLKDAAKTLFAREFTLYSGRQGTDEETVIVSRWLSASSYANGKGELGIMFSGVVIPYITRLEAAFTKYRLEQIANMTSAHAVRLYELLIQWGSAGNRITEIGWLRKVLLLEDQYAAIKDFKKYVIDVAVAQINAHSDLTVSYTQRKTGRAVTNFIFAFDYKPDQKAPQKSHKESDALANKQAKMIAQETAKTNARDEKEAAIQRKRAEDDELIESFKELPKTAKDEIVAIAIMTNAVLRNQYARKGLDSAPVRAAILASLRT